MIAASTILDIHCLAERPIIRLTSKGIGSTHRTAECTRISERLDQIALADPRLRANAEQRRKRRGPETLAGILIDAILGADVAFGNRPGLTL